MITWSILRKALYIHLLLLLLLALFYRWAKYDSERLSNLARVTQSFSLRQYGSRAHVLYSIIYSTTNSSSTCTQLGKAASWHISSKFTREESIHALASIFYQHFLSFPEWPPMPITVPQLHKQGMRQTQFLSSTSILLVGEGADRE